MSQVAFTFQNELNVLLYEHVRLFEFGLQCGYLIFFVAIACIVVSIQSLEHVSLLPAKPHDETMLCNSRANYFPT